MYPYSKIYGSFRERALGFFKSLMKCRRKPVPFSEEFSLEKEKED
jgi:hypothetical protein